MEKILECILRVSDVERHFVFNGELMEEIDFDEGLPFTKIGVFEVCEGVAKPFQIRATTWQGAELTAYDAIGDVLSQYTRGDMSMEALYLHPVLKTYLDQVKKDCIHVGEISIPKKISYGSFLELYELFYATDQYLFYTASGNSYVMLVTDTRGEIASEYFAEVGFMDSVENVAAGREILYFSSEDSEEDYAEEKERARLLEVLQSLKVGDKVHIVQYDGVDGHGVVVAKSDDTAEVLLHDYVMCHPNTSLVNEYVTIKTADLSPELCLWHTIEIEA